MFLLWHPSLTAINLSYTFPILETSATALCGTTGTHISHTLMIQCQSLNQTQPRTSIGLCNDVFMKNSPWIYRTKDQLPMHSILAAACSYKHRAMTRWRIKSVGNESTKCEQKLQQASLRHMPALLQLQACRLPRASKASSFSGETIRNIRKLSSGTVSDRFFVQSALEISKVFWSSNWNVHCVKIWDCFLLVFQLLIMKSAKSRPSGSFQL